MTALDNAPSKTGKPSGDNRGNKPAKGKPLENAPSKTGKPSGTGRSNNPAKGK